MNDRMIYIIGRKTYMLLCINIKFNYIYSIFVAFWMHWTECLSPSSLNIYKICLSAAFFEEHFHVPHSREMYTFYCLNQTMIAEIFLSVLLFKIANQRG